MDEISSQHEKIIKLLRAPITKKLTALFKKAETIPLGYWSKTEGHHNKLGVFARIQNEKTIGALYEKNKLMFLDSSIKVSLPKGAMLKTLADGLSKLGFKHLRPNGSLKTKTLPLNQQLEFAASKLKITGADIHFIFGRTMQTANLYVRIKIPAAARAKLVIKDESIAAGQKRIAKIYRSLLLVQ